MANGQRGRKSLFKDEYIEQAYKLCQLGATDVQIAEFFGVTEKTLNNWKHAHPEFLQSLKNAKDDLDARVERSLFERATGYSHPEDKIFNHAGEPLIVPTVKHHAPDVTAQIFWLKNRQPDRWRDKQEVHNTGEITVKVTRKKFDGSDD
jgi:hypothetical protein